MCGVFGVIADDPEEDVFADVVAGLFQMQHRGQDACGIAVSDGSRLRVERGLGLVKEVFGDRPHQEFRGNVGIGHVRYPTQGGNRIVNTQPHKVATLEGTRFALASNGDVTNYEAVRERLIAAGVEFTGTNDAELILKTIAHRHLVEGADLVDAIFAMMAEVRGAYSACLMTRDEVFAFRDVHAIRPLSFGRTNGTDGRSGALVVASESNALDICGADIEASVGPGEVVRMSRRDGRAQFQRFVHPKLAVLRGDRQRPAHCSFEHVYFSRPDAIAFGQRVYDVRKRIGARLADEDPVAPDVCVPVPDSANAVALGYAHQKGVAFEFGLIRNHYVGRTFINPEQPRRDEGVRQKFNPLRSVFKGRRVVLVDDSVVRGTTLRKLVRMVRRAGASEVHVRIGSPPTKYSCYYGVDTPDAAELIATTMSTDGIREHLGADSLRYLSLEGLSDCIADDGDYCRACFDGNYPVPVPSSKREKSQLDAHR